MKGARLNFNREWDVGDQIGGGGFGQVYEATAQDGKTAAVKFVPKDDGAERELLFVDIPPEVRNVVHIIDSGEYEGYWALVMPRAEHSLRDQLDEADGPFELEAALDVLRDVADALADLDGVVVHRDLKPENVLRLESHWCLADFGISRYAEATTAPDTRKFALTPAYASPERWRSERATTAADVYALGVMAFEMLTGSRPFKGDSLEAFREAHLHADPPRLTTAPSALAALVDECLYKAPEARPTPANIRTRLDRISEAPGSEGLARLQDANRAEVLRRSEAARERSEAQTEADRREALRARPHSMKF